MPSRLISPDPTEPSIARRRVLRGASWTVPAVALSGLAPAIASSPGPCDEPLTFGDWEVELIQGALAGPSYSTDTFDPVETLRDNFYTTHYENRRHAGDGNAETAIVTVTGQTEVIAGTTYSIEQFFSVRFPGDDIRPDGANTYAHVQMGEEILFRGEARPQTDTRDTIATSGGSPREKTYYWLYTATTTGTIDYQYTFYLGTDQQKANPDKALGNPTVAVRFPTIVCATA